jgi:hypothetical protein
MIGTPPRLPRWRFVFIGSGSPRTALSRLGAAEFPIEVRRVDTIDRQPSPGGEIKLIKSEVSAAV